MEKTLGTLCAAKGVRAGTMPVCLDQAFCV